MLPQLRWTNDERADLHVHSHYSDGLHSPVELVRMAAEQGISILGLTDHATMAGVAEAVLAGVDHGVYVLPGIELNGIHWDFLGFLPDGSQSAFVRFLDDCNELRQHRMQEILHITTRTWGSMDWEELVECAHPAKPARPHLARMLVGKGIFPDLDSVFQNFLRPGRRGYVPAVGPSDQSCIQAITDAGGVTVVAHPHWTVTRGHFPLAPEVRRLNDWGVVGCEAVLPGTGDQTRLAEWHQAVKEAGWVEVNGSNFHGRGVYDAELGSSTMGTDQVLTLLKRLPDHCLHAAWFKRLHWRAANLTRTELQNSLTPQEIPVDTLVREDLLQFEPKMLPRPPDYMGSPFVLVGPGAVGREQAIKDILLQFGISMAGSFALSDYPTVAWTLYGLYRLPLARKRQELFKFSLDRHLFGERFEQASVLFFQPGSRTINFREIKQAIRQQLGLARFYRVCHNGHAEVNFTAYIHIPEEVDVAQECWSLCHLSGVQLREI
ncbi:MAG: PHP domain-containing protein [Magnetococcus sp. YQC-5]